MLTKGVFGAAVFLKYKQNRFHVCGDLRRPWLLVVPFISSDFFVFVGAALRDPRKRVLRIIGTFDGVCDEIFL